MTRSSGISSKVHVRCRTANQLLDELGWVHPNPPIQNNRCYTFLARGLERVGDPVPDPNEILELAPHRLADVPRLIAERQITHALVLAAFHLLDGRGDS